jgi:hypothetical protein
VGRVCCAAGGGEGDRIPEILATLSPLPCPVDVFVLTSEELAHAIREQSPLVREALEHGQDLLMV